MLEYNKIMETKIADTSTFLFSVRDSVRKSLLRLRSELSVSINAKYGDFFVIISPYVNAIIFQRIESQPMDYNKQLMNALLEKLQSIYETNKNGVKYKLGLWTGLFLSGAAWDTSGTSIQCFRCESMIGSNMLSILGVVMKYSSTLVDLPIFLLKN